MKTVNACSAHKCKKAKECALYCGNVAIESENCIMTTVDYSSVGSGAAWTDSKTGLSKIEVTYSCGPAGKYKLFSEFKPALINLTLGEVKQICSEHQKQNRDCETCKIYNFCTHEMTCGCPSGWELDGGDK